MGEVDTDWIKPGAEVVVYSTGTSPNPRRTTVDRVAAQSFTLVGVGERIRLDTLESKRLGGEWHRYRLVVIHPNSEKALRLFNEERVQQLRAKACSAVDAWNMGGHREDVMMLDDAIEALQAYRSALGKDGQHG